MLEAPGVRAVAFPQLVVLALVASACASVSHPRSPTSVPVRLCVVVEGRLADVDADYRPATGDTLVQGVSLTDAVLYTRHYAASADWFLRNEPIPGEPRPDARGAYVKYGRERQMPVTMLRYVTEHQEVGVYAESDDHELYPGVIYVPVRPGCWMQSYQYVGLGTVRENR